jgi:hypothetical protein
MPLYIMMPNEMTGDKLWGVLEMAKLEGNNQVCMKHFKFYIVG